MLYPVFIIDAIIIFTIVQRDLCYLVHVDFLMILVIYYGFTHYVFICKMLCQQLRNKKTVKPVNFFPINLKLVYATIGNSLSYFSDFTLIRSGPTLKQCSGLLIEQLCRCIGEMGVACLLEKYRVGPWAQRH